MSGYIPPKTLKGGSQKDKFIAAVFTITKIWQLPKCPSTDEEQDICIQWSISSA